MLLYYGCCIFQPFLAVTSGSNRLCNWPFKVFKPTFFRIIIFPLIYSWDIFFQWCTGLVFKNSNPYSNLESGLNHSCCMSSCLLSDKNCSQTICIVFLCSLLLYILTSIWVMCLPNAGIICFFTFSNEKHKKE